MSVTRRLPGLAASGMATQVSDLFEGFRQQKGSKPDFCHSDDLWEPAAFSKNTLFSRAFPVVPPPGVEPGSTA
jgi:hypothetical protein